MEEKIVLSNWLSDRFEVDAEARNKKVETHFLKLISEKPTLNLIDLGSGTGGNLVYLMPKINSNQNWHLVEQDAILIDACKQRLSQLFEVSNSSGHTMSIKNEANAIHLTWHNMDISEFLENPSYPNKFDVLTASALFDVLPKATFQKIRDFTLSKKLLLFSTLNYKNTLFKNANKADNYYAQLYQKHMKLPQTYGIKMGGDCKTDILSSFNKTEKQNLFIGESNWLLNQTHTRLLKQLIQFFAESIPDLLSSDEEHQTFSNWVNIKNEQIDKQELSIVVEHFDFLFNS